MAGWCKISVAAEYAGVHVKTFRRWMKHGLRFVVMPSGTQLTKYEWIDQFLTTYEAGSAAADVDRIVDDVLEGIC